MEVKKLAGKDQQADFLMEALPTNLKNHHYQEVDLWLVI
jgi:hypothetical protein